MKSEINLKRNEMNKDLRKDLTEWMAERGDPDTKKLRVEVISFRSKALNNCTER